MKEDRVELGKKRKQQGRVRKERRKDYDGLVKGKKEKRNYVG